MSDTVYIAPTIRDLRTQLIESGIISLITLYPNTPTLGAQLAELGIETPTIKYTTLVVVRERDNSRTVYLEYELGGPLSPIAANL